MYHGPLHQILKVQDSYTAQALKRYFSTHSIHGIGTK